MIGKLKHKELVISAVVLIALLILSLIPSYIAFADDNETCPSCHSDDVDTVVDRDEPTCENDGTEAIWLCNNCSNEWGGWSIPALGHDFDDWTTVTEPTCTTAGTEAHTCKRAKCGYQETQVLPALGHDFDEWTTVTEPTCTTAGTEAHTCQRSGCGKIETQEISALGHDFDEWTTVTEPTCTETGSEKHTCKRQDCGFEETQVLPATGHHFCHHERVEPTCTKDGNIEYWHCAEEDTDITYCGKYFTDSLGQHEITQPETILNVPHELVEHPAVAPTKESVGNIQYWKCSCCNECFADSAATKQISESETIIPKLNDEAQVETNAVTSGGSDSTKTGDFSPIAPLILSSILALAGFGIYKTRKYAF